MLTLNSNILKIGNKWILPVQSGGVVPPEPPEYDEYWLNVTASSSHKIICIHNGMINGSNSGNALEGISYNPDTGIETLTDTYLRLGGTDPYVYAGSQNAQYITIQLNVTEALTSLSFSVYTQSAATITLVGRDSYGTLYQLARSTIGASSDYYEYQNVTMDLSTVYNITCTDDGNGTLSSDIGGGIADSISELTATPDTGYMFDSYTLVSGTGASISGNILRIGTSDVTVRANFVAIPSGYDHYEVRFTSTNTSSDSVSIWAINTRPDSGYWYDNWNRQTNLTSGSFDNMQSSSNGYDGSFTNQQYLSLTFSDITGGVLTWYDSLNQWFTPSGSNITATLYGVDSLGNMTQLDQIGPYTNTYNVQRSLSIV